MADTPGVIVQNLDKIREFIDSFPVIKKYAAQVEQSTKVNYEYIAVGILTIMAIMLFTGIGDELIVHLFAFVYPFVQTIKVIESGNKSEYTDWLIYWVVYGFMGVLDTFSDYFLYWIPFFAPAKLAFLVWCWAPNYKGSNTIYYSLVQPLFKQHESTIDSALNNVLDPKSILKAARAISKDE